MTSASRSTAVARAERSAGLPSGVATTASVPGGVGRLSLRLVRRLDVVAERITQLRFQELAQLLLQPLFDLAGTLAADAVVRAELFQRRRLVGEQAAAEDCSSRSRRAAPNASSFTRSNS